MEDLVFKSDNKTVTTSRLIAAKFGKRHADVLRKIESLNSSSDFTERNFALSGYNDATGRKCKEYMITRDGFAFLVMGFTGKEAARFKEDFINAFNSMEAQLKTPKTRAEMLLEQAQLLVEIERTQQDHDQRLKVIEAKTNSSDIHYFTIAGYASLVGRKVDITEAARLGRKATRMCGQLGYITGTMPDPRFGRVKTYPEEVLEKLIMPGAEA